MKDTAKVKFAEERRKEFEERELEKRRRKDDWGDVEGQWNLREFEGGEGDGRGGMEVGGGGKERRKQESVSGMVVVNCCK